MGEDNPSLLDVMEKLGELRSESRFCKEGIRELRNDFSTFKTEVRKALKSQEEKLVERNGTRYLARLGIVAAIAAIAGGEAKGLIIRIVQTLF